MKTVYRQPVRTPDWLYTLVVAALGIYFVIGALVWSFLILSGRTVPDSFATVLATIAGGLIGVLKPVHHESAGKGTDTK
ncbi:MAG: hypothetical protein ACRDZO_15860 [Egibacteraceae bacterium]